jgi:hypothetical protein
MELAKGNVISVPAGAVVRVDRGVLWLTQYPDRNDYFLRAGESMHLSGKGVCLVSALHESDFRVIAAERRESRLRQFLASLAPRMRPA